VTPLYDLEVAHHRRRLDRLHNSGKVHILTVKHGIIKHRKGRVNACGIAKGGKIISYEIILFPGKNIYAAEIAGFAGTDPAEAVQALLDARAAARKEKNWAVADGVRDGLKNLGFVIEDTPQGARVTYGA